MTQGPRKVSSWQQEIDLPHLLETAGAALILFQGTRLLYVNQTACQITGYQREELLQQSFWDVVHPDYREAVKERGLQRQAGAELASQYELALLTRQGETRYVTARMRIIEHEGKPAVLVAADDITERRRVQTEYQEIFEGSPVGILRFTADGSVLKANPTALRLVPHLSPELCEQLQQPGEFELQLAPGIFVYVRSRAVEEGFEAFLEDISPRRLLEERLREAQKMEAIGRLAGGVAHDFNNLLTVVTSYGEMLAQRMPVSSSGREWVEQILEASERARDLTRQLLAFGRKQQLKPQSLSLNELVEDLRRLLPPLLGPQVELRLKLCPDGALVSADPVQLQQVVLNLVVNARDAMPEGGILRLSTGRRCLPEPEAAGQGLPPGDYVELTVEDEGIGMDAEIRARIFEPFFTTKAMGQGTGLGLATVYGIVRQSEGAIEVQSEPGAGAIFRVLLPAVAAPAGQGALQVLLVEDDVAVRTVVRKMLETQGFEVVEARDAEEGLELASRRRYGLVITDVVMPGMNGLELAQKLRAMVPEQRLLVISGFRNKVDDSLAFLAKPFSPDRLLGKVREVLSS